MEEKAKYKIEVVKIESVDKSGIANIVRCVTGQHNGFPALYQSTDGGETWLWIADFANMSAAQEIVKEGVITEVVER